MHRNTFLRSPDILSRNYALDGQPLFRFAGQLTGVEAVSYTHLDVYKRQGYPTGWVQDMWFTEAGVSLSLIHI